jgi:hypothetical protein
VTFNTFAWMRGIRSADLKSEKAVALMIGLGADSDTGIFRTSVASIARDCVKSESTVHRAIRELVADGWLEVLHAGGGGPKDPRVYQLRIGNTAQIVRSKGVTETPSKGVSETGVSQGHAEGCLTDTRSTLCSTINPLPPEGGTGEAPLVLASPAASPGPVTPSTAKPTRARKAKAEPERTAALDRLRKVHDAVTAAKFGTASGWSDKAGAELLKRLGEPEAIRRVQWAFGDDCRKVSPTIQKISRYRDDFRPPKDWRAPSTIATPSTVAPDPQVAAIKRRLQQQLDADRAKQGTAA